MRRIAAIFLLTVSGVAVGAFAQSTGAPTIRPPRPGPNPISAADKAPVPPISGKLGTPVELFNGKDLSGWSWQGRDSSTIGDVWSVQDGVLRSKARKIGYISVAATYTNFVLTVEQRHLARGNGGFFVCLHGADKVWPDGIQIQGKSGAVGDLINQNSSMKMTTEPARTKKVNKDVIISRMGPDNEKPLHEWNTLVVTVDHGNLTVTLNGKLQNWATGIDPASGRIALQDEGTPMEFRKVELTPIEEGAAK